MSLKQLISDHVTSVFLNDEHFAVTATHYPLGDTDSGASVVGVPEWEDPAESRQGGKDTKQRGKFHVSSSVSVTRRDQWLIESVLYQTAAISPVQGGMIAVEIVRTDPEFRSEGRGVL